MRRCSRVSGVLQLTLTVYVPVLQVCVPKNTVLVVTREKGGFLSVLQSSLSTGAEPDPRLAEVRFAHRGFSACQVPACVFPCLLSQSAP